jgi:mRNA interferase RelE/StbE
MFDVILSPEVEAFHAAADPLLARKLARCFAQLERDPRRHNNIKRLSGELAGLSRYRVGDWRVLFRVYDAGA